MTAARKLYTFGPRLAVCEPARRIVDPTPAEVIAFTRRPSQRQNRGRIATSRIANPATIVTSVPIVGWWRADLGYTIATGVSQWTDQKNGLQLVQAAGASQPTYSASDAAFGGKPSITFDGVNDELTGAFACPAPGTTPRFYWMVLKNIAMGVPAFVFCGAGVTSHILYRQGADAADQISQFNTAKVNTTSNFTAGTARVVQVSFTNSAADYVKVGGTGPTTGASAGNASAASWILGSSGGGNFGSFSVSEILITQGAPTELSQLAVYAGGFYLATVNA